MPIAAGILEMLAGFVVLASAFSIFTILRMEAPQPWEELSFSFYGLVHLVFGLGWWLISPWITSFSRKPRGETPKPVKET